MMENSLIKFKRQLFDVNPEKISNGVYQCVSYSTNVANGIIDYKISMPGNKFNHPESVRIEYRITPKKMYTQEEMLDAIYTVNNRIDLVNDFIKDHSPIVCDMRDIVTDRLNHVSIFIHRIEIDSQFNDFFEINLLCLKQYSDDKYVAEFDVVGDISQQTIESMSNSISRLLIPAFVSSTNLKLYTGKIIGDVINSHPKVLEIVKNKPIYINYSALINYPVMFIDDDFIGLMANNTSYEFITVDMVENIISEM